MRFTRRVSLTKLVSCLVSASVLAGCATPGQPGGSVVDKIARVGKQTPATMEAAQLTRQPCDEAVKREEVFSKAMVGALVGVAAGALLGSLIAGNKHHKDGAKLGAFVGLLVGGKLGYDKGMDSARRQCDVWKAAEQLRVEQGFATLMLGSEVAGEVIVAPDEGHFHPGSALLTSRGEAYYRAIAKQYTTAEQIRSYEGTVRSAAKRSNDETASNYRSYSTSAADQKDVAGMWSGMRILLTGHTDDQVNSDTSLAISQERALTVAKLFRSAGVEEAALLFQGAGAAFPIADNATELGRRKNNRVEVVVIYSEQALANYQASQQPNVALFSPPRPPAAAAKPIAAPTRSTLTAAPGAGSPVTSKSGAVGAQAEAPNKASTTPASKTPAPNVAAAPKPVKPVATPEGPKQVAAAALPPTFLPLDLGGEDLTEANVGGAVQRLGKVKPPSLSLASLFGIGTAHAERLMPASCHLDRASNYLAGEIKRLGTGEAALKGQKRLSANDAYLGIVGRSYAGDAGTSFIEVRGVTPNASGSLAEPVSFNVYERFAGKSDADKRVAQPDVTVGPTAVAIRGDGGVLVRQFFANGRGLECMDFLIPNNLSSRRAEDATLIYRVNGKPKVARPTLSASTS